MKKISLKNKYYFFPIKTFVSCFIIILDHFFFIKKKFIKFENTKSATTIANMTFKKIACCSENLLKKSCPIFLNLFYGTYNAIF